VSGLANSWQHALSNKKFVLQFVASIVALVLIISFLPWYFQSVIGPKPGIYLHDPILDLVGPIDFTWAIFILIYSTLFIVLFNTIKQPFQLLLALECYLTIMILRVISMYLITLEPPLGMIVLIDPFIDKIAYGGEPFTKDLFFSGHVSTVMLLGLIEQRSIVKKIILSITPILALLILLQRVHYTIDVVVAPFIAYGVFKWVSIGSKDQNYR
jgi:hypothetical protein